MMREFVIGDLHGAYRALRQCLDRAGFDYEQDSLVLVGDIADGFAEVFECVEELLKINNLIALKGNHDDWFNQFLLTDYHPAQWGFGGKGTLISYLKHAGKPDKYFGSNKGFKTALVKEDIPHAHRRFFESLQLYYIDDKNRCFLHAGFNGHLPFFGQRPEEYFWNRELWQDAMRARDDDGLLNGRFYEDCNFNEIYIGHTPTTKFGSDKPLKALNVINMDTGAGHSGRLSVMDINSKEFWQSDPVSLLYQTTEMHR